MLKIIYSQLLDPTDHFFLLEDVTYNLFSYIPDPTWTGCTFTTSSDSSQIACTALRFTPVAVEIFLIDRGTSFLRFMYVITSSVGVDIDVSIIIVILRLMFVYQCKILFYLFKLRDNTNTGVVWYRIKLISGDGFPKTVQNWTFWKYSAEILIIFEKYFDCFSFFLKIL